MHRTAIWCINQLLSMIYRNEPVCTLLHWTASKSTANMHQNMHQILPCTLVWATGSRLRADCLSEGDPALSTGWPEWDQLLSPHDHSLLGDDLSWVGISLRISLGECIGDLAPRQIPSGAFAQRLQAGARQSCDLRPPCPERDTPFTEIEAYVARWESLLSPRRLSRLALMSSGQPAPTAELKMSLPPG